MEHCYKMACGFEPTGSPMGLGERQIDHLTHMSCVEKRALSQRRLRAASSPSGSAASAFSTGPATEFSLISLGAGWFAELDTTAM
jgi:hypothetical protein